MLINTALICHWWEPSDRPGDKLFVPGCWPRLYDPEGPCECTPAVAEIAEMRRERRELTRERDRLQRQYSALLAAVSGRPDSAEIHEKAAQYFRITQDVAEQNERERGES
ncbi:hypothetical protein [Microbispora sp. NPDC049125]|uniref:hypothetical protein n=1 Tax=Microbispora sp. NPDC049125 TaxID=3154929 RepID=UPI0034658CF5